MLFLIINIFFSHNWGFGVLKLNLNLIKFLQEFLHLFDLWKISNNGFDAVISFSLLDRFADPEAQRIIGSITAQNLKGMEYIFQYVVESLWCFFIEMHRIQLIYIFLG